MQWQDILAHDDVVAQLRSRFAAGKLYGTFLFVGPPGVGKRTVARLLAQTLLCQGGTHREFEPCGECEDCRLFAAGNHPDLLVVEKPADKNTIPLELILGSEERRMREGLCHDIGLKPFRGGRRVAIIDDADDLNREGANALLKTLEEPPPKSVMILIGTSADRQLPTIRSRSQLIRFAPLPVDAAVRLLRSLGVAATDEEAARLAALSGGSLTRAKYLADPAFAEFRRTLYDALVERGFSGIDMAKRLTGFAEESGKEPAARRERLRWTIGFLIELFRQTTHVLVGGITTDDAELQQAAERLARSSPFDLERLATVVDRCLLAVEQIDRNAHTNMLVDAFCDDVQRLLADAAQAVSP